MTAIPIILISLAVIAVLLLLAAQIRAAGGNGRRALRTVAELEQLAADRLVIEPYDLTAQSVATTIRKANRNYRELS